MVTNPLHEPSAWIPFVTALRRSAPPDVREAEFRGTLSAGGFGGSTAYDGDSRREGLDPDGFDSPMDALRPLSKLAGHRVAVRATVTASGAGVVSIVESSPQVSFGMMASQLLEAVVLAAGAVPEPHRRVPERHTGAAVSPGADASVVSALVRELLPAASPASLPDLAAAEARLGAALPEDVRALYLAAGSGVLALQPADDELLFGMQIVSLDDAAARACVEPEGRYGSWSESAIEVVAPDPHGRVQSLGSSPAWFVLGYDGGGNMFVVDLAPGPHGTVGQILYVDRGEIMGAQWLAPSLTELLTERPAEPADPGAAAGLLVRVGPRTGKTLADVQPDTEVLYVSPAPAPVDLAPLAGHRRLRTLVTESAAVTDLTGVAGLPALEFLELDVAGWQQLLRAGQLPPALLAAGLSGRADWTATVEVVNGLLSAGNQAPLAVTDIPVTAA